jgi:drug/metabolite transporter (DMT)-like permease
VKSSAVNVSCAIGTALLFGSTVPISKHFLDQVQPWMLVGLMFLGAGLGLGIIYLIRGQFILPTALLKRPDYKLLGITLLLQGVIAPVLLAIGLLVTPATVAALLLNFECVFTVILAWTVFREPWRWPVFGGMIVITAAGVILSQGLQGGLAFSWGSLAIIGTCGAWALDSNLTKELADRDPLQIAMLKTSGAGLINVVIALLVGQSLPALPTLLSILGAGFICYGIGIVLLILSLRNLGAARTGVYLSISPFVGAAIALISLKEPITSTLVTAAVLMVIGAGLCMQE